MQDDHFSYKNCYQHGSTESVFYFSLLMCALSLLKNQITLAIVWKAPA